MALERRDPVPPGIYWLDVPQARVGEFNAWASARDVVVRRSVEKPNSDEPVLTWYLFEVLQPTPWVNIGLPTIAEQGGETTYEDTSQRPEPEPDPLWNAPWPFGRETWQDALGNSAPARAAGKAVLTVALVGAGGYLAYLAFGAAKGKAQQWRTQ